MRAMLTPGRLQRLIQTVFFLFILFMGWRFSRFVLWATGQTEVFTPRPASVEGFLPIAALMGLRRLLESGVWDAVHPAGLAIFLAALGMALVVRKGFCGFICPVGLISGLLDTLGRRLNLSLVPGGIGGRVLAAPKYLILAFFLFTVFIGMDRAAVESFATTPYNSVADARMLHFFQSPSALTLSMLAGLAGLGVVFRGAWCRWLCPYGALLGLLSWFGPIRVHREAESCIGCRQCSRACPGGIRVHEKDAVLSPDCLGCLRCQEACPVPGCITARVAGRSIPFWVTGLGSVAMLLAAWILARQFGLWDQDIPLPMVRRFYQMFL